MIDKIIEHFRKHPDYILSVNDDLTPAYLKNAMVFNMKMPSNAFCTKCTFIIDTRLKTLSIGFSISYKSSGTYSGINIVEIPRDVNQWLPCVLKLIYKATITTSDQFDMNTYQYISQLQHIWCNDLKSLKSLTSLRSSRSI